MTTSMLPEVPVIHVDCPLCDRPAPFDLAEGALECDTCGVRLELAAVEARALPAAA